MTVATPRIKIRGTAQFGAARNGMGWDGSGMAWEWHGMGMAWHGNGVGWGGMAWEWRSMGWIQLPQLLWKKMGRRLLRHLMRQGKGCHVYGDQPFSDALRKS
eukprot:362078-Chlamydomonas_euryale.AAC.6